MPIVIIPPETYLGNTVFARFGIVKGLILEHLLASSDIYGNYENNPLYKEELINTEIRFANDEVVKTVCETANHPRRILYEKTMTGIESGKSLPASVGDVSTRIVIVGGKEVDGETVSSRWLNELQKDLTKPEGSQVYGNTADKQGYFYTKNGKIYFIGVTATATFCSPEAAAGVVLTAPSEYEVAIKNLALSNLYMKHGSQPNGAGYYNGMYQNTISFVRGEAKLLPVFEQYKQER